MQDRIQGLVRRPLASNLPSVVWLCDPSYEKAVRKIWQVICGAERIAIPLRRFRCLRIDVESLPEGELREACRDEAHAFYFFDPAGELVKKVAGKRATSASAFLRDLEQAWNRSFTLAMKDYVKRTKTILIRLDTVSTMRGRLDEVREKLEASPDPVRRERPRKLAAQLEEAEREIAEEEEAIRTACALRPEFLPENAR